MGSAASRRFARIAERVANGERVGMTSVCSAHPLVIEAALRHGMERDRDVLIEATCNQVNQDGGYTGLTPRGFRNFVEGIARSLGFDPGRLILGGDHLGPNPWKHLPPAEAMAKAETMIAAFAQAGFAKLHLDTSMGCRGEREALDDATTAERAASLAARAEAALPGTQDTRPLYVVGTEVPVPGGAFEALDHLAVTRPEAALRTLRVHRNAFDDRGLGSAFSRVIAVVVQPGVEFGNAERVVYDPSKAAGLSGVLARMPQVVFEAHSTDYQPAEALGNLVRDGFAILKVGPWLTFALREALYGLAGIADVLVPDPALESLPDTMERLMLASPSNWRKYYPGSPREQRVLRHFSFSDRIRYYWPDRDAREAVEALLSRLGNAEIPATLVSQHLGHLYDPVIAGVVRPRARDLLSASVARILDIYDAATRPPV